MPKVQKLARLHVLIIVISLSLTHLQCPLLTTDDLTNGDFLPEVTIDSITPLSRESLQVVYSQDMADTGIAEIDNYRISSNQGELAILLIDVLPNSNNRILTITTGEQEAERIYTITVNGVSSSLTHMTPEAGISYEFKGYTVDLNTPDINLTQDEISYASGGLFNLPDVETGTVSAAVEFAIENKGALDLLLFGSPAVAISGDDAELFTVNQPESSLVAGGDSLVFSISYTGSQTGSKSATLEIESTDPDEPVYRLALVGNVVDSTAPDTGSNVIAVSNIGKNSVDLDWTAASDNLTGQADLQYKVFYSLSSVFNSVGAVEGLGTAASGFEADITESTVTGLEPATSYYFNVLVKDSEGNLAVYQAGTATTQAVAEMVTDINPGVADSNPAHLHAFNGKLYFQANDGSTGTELYELDPDNTPSLIDIRTGSGSSSPQYMYGFGGKVYFSADDGTDGRELWEYDGVSASLTYDINSGSGSSTPVHMIEYNGKLHFGTASGTSALWEYTGSGAPAQVTGSEYDYDTASTMAVVNGYLFFHGVFNVTTPALGNTAYPGIYDGVNPPYYVTGFPSFVEEMRYTVAFNDKAYFATDSDGGGFMTLNEHDPVAGTTNTRDPFGDTSHYAVFNGNLYYSSGDGCFCNTELFVYTGSGSRSRVADINPGSGSSYPRYLTVSDGKLYFSADDGTNGRELWVYDGVNPPEMAIDINPGADSDPANLVDLDGTLYFQANDGVSGAELWKLN